MVAILREEPPIKAKNAYLKPENCYCSELHRKTKSCCVACWDLGFRYNSPGHHKVWWNQE